jgi:CDP-diacylglycerol--glycerol-3-phosphate 3-phosphatidyltransferase
MKLKAEANTVQHPPGFKAALRAIAVALSKFVAGTFGFARDGIARAFIRVGIPANAVTLMAPFAVCIVFFAAYNGDQPMMAAVLILAGAFDLLDGAVARISRGSTPFGGLLDSVVDRYTDFVMLFGILVYLNRHVHGPYRLLYFILWGFTLVGTGTTAYVRARAETIIPSCKVGFMERAERTVTVIIGLLASNVHITLWILAVMTNVISIQRICYARLRMSDREAKGKFWFWMYPRLTAPHFTLCATFILFLIIGHLIIPRP